MVRIPYFLNKKILNREASSHLTIQFIGLCFLYVPNLSAQLTISGKILDETNEPLPFANVSFLTAADFSMVKG
ncbi:MAG: hypothetical protein ACI9XO_002936 [Paraglaciecola sp.]|jgi:hypothetical protein